MVDASHEKANSEKSEDAKPLVLISLYERTAGLPKERIIRQGAGSTAHPPLNFYLGRWAFWYPGPINTLIISI